MPAFIDLSGQRFGRLVAIRPDTTKSRKWVCRCDCGTEKSVNACSLKAGSSASCGCLRADYYAGQVIDLSGQRFGRLVAVEIDGSGGRTYRWRCKCDCGNIVTYLGSSLRRGVANSCGCSRFGRRLPESEFNLTGKRFGRLVAVEQVDNNKRLGRWKCLCDCGTTHIVQGETLRYGKCRSCGCLQQIAAVQTGSLLKSKAVKHGRSQTPEYTAWKGMKLRCLNPNNQSYADYGGRGIKVCKRWLAFENFYADMGPRPSSKHSLGRRNVNRGYTPSNCRWETASEQARCRRSNRLIAAAGRTLTLMEWAKETGHYYATLYSRLENGWPVSKALFTPLLRKGYGAKKKANRDTTKPEYICWQAMRRRCERADPNYGGRGIKVCKRWKSFSAFLADMRPRPSLRHSIDRVDPNGNYSPKNCRWATTKEQGRTRRNTFKITHNGLTLSASEWAEKYGIRRDLLVSRIRRGWPLLKAVLPVPTPTK